MKLGWEEARALRLERHHLHRRAPRGRELRVAGRICGLHAQLLSSAALSLWARVEGMSLEAFQRALWRERKLVKIWAMRGTLHLLPARDLPVYLGALSTYTHYLTQRWVKYVGITRDEIELVIATVGEVLRGRALTRDQLADAVVERTGSKKLGMWLFIMSDAITFAAILMAYCYVRVASAIMTTSFASDWSLANRRDVRLLRDHFDGRL